MIEDGLGFVSFEPGDVIDQNRKGDGEEPEQPGGQKLRENDGAERGQIQVRGDVPSVQQGDDMRRRGGARHDADEDEVQEDAPRPPDGRFGTEVLPTDILGRRRYGHFPILDVERIRDGALGFLELGLFQAGEERVHPRVLEHDVHHVLLA